MVVDSKTENKELSEQQETEIIKLKRLIITFKKKYQHALQNLATKEKIFEESISVKKYRELEEENSALIDQQNMLKDMLQKAQKTSSHPKKEIATHEIVSKKDQHIQHLEKSLREKEITIASKISEAKEIIENLEKDRSHLQETCNTLYATIKELSDEKKAIKASLKEKDQKIEQLSLLKEEKASLEKILEKETFERQKEVHERATMKQTLVHTLCELREMKQLYQNASRDKEEELKKQAHLQRRVQELKKELEEQGQAKDILRKQIEEGKAEQDNWEKKLLQEEQERKKCEQEIHEKEESILSLSEQIKTIQSQLKNTESLVQERNKNILEARQHLAKKVKETSQLKEANEEQSLQLVKLEEQIIDSKAKISELQTSVDSHLENQKKQQEKLTAMEKKYFQAYEKWQTMEAQNNELKKIQEKYEQLQKLLMNLGTAVGSPIGFTAPLAPQPLESVKAKNDNEKQSPAPAEEQTLFNTKKLTTPYKKDLFE